jgi:hypothetical protein
VAADAGTAISMSNGSATTITVNTGLFAAGDIVTIINLGAGVCTITAGTATVTTSGSLALAQNQGGVLRFTSASAAIFFQFATPASGDIEGVTAGTGISGGGTSGTVTITNSMATEIDAKGDLIVGTGADAFARLAVGTNGHTLVADSSVSPTGLKWAAPAGGGKVLQVVQVETNAQTTVSSTSFTDTSLSATITPTSATSKILVLISQSVYAAQAQGTGSQNFNRAVVKLLRGGTDIRDFGYVKTFASPAITGLDMHGGGTVFLQYLDSPATTSATTYKTQGKSGTTSGGAFVQFQISLTGSDQGYSAMTLLEIGA